MFDVLYFNIMMIGEIGVGKFFFFNIVLIVLENWGIINDVYRVGSGESREKSVIKKVFYLKRFFFLL